METSELTQSVVQVMERTERLMMKAIVRYREDRDLENAIDFIQKKVKEEDQRQFVCWWRCGTDFCLSSFSAAVWRATRTGPVTFTSSVQRQTPVWRPVEFLSPAASSCRTRSGLRRALSKLSGLLVAATTITSLLHTSWQSNCPRA